MGGTIGLMKTRSLAVAITAVFLSAAAWAADVTGTWKGEINGPNGSFSLTYNFKQDGAKLTGSVVGPQGDPLPLEEGKVEAGKIHFTINVPMNGGMKVVNDGEIKGDDEISLQAKGEGGEPFGDPISIKRQK
jgi:hypothetical protein